MKSFAELSEQEVLALAISNEDEDNRIYRSFADALRESYPDTAEMYDKMAQEEIGHRDALLALHLKKFGDFLPLIRRQDVKGFVARRPIWLNRPLALDATRKFAEAMELETARFYRRAAALYYTTPETAARVAELLLEHGGVRDGVLLDPCAGAGAFLLAAARRNHNLLETSATRCRRLGSLLGYYWLRIGNCEDARAAREARAKADRRRDGPGGTPVRISDCSRGTGFSFAFS